MTFSFLVNGRFTFGSARPTLRQAGRFLATTGVVLYVIQPLIIHALLGLAHRLHTVGDQVLLAKLGAICVVLVLNFAAYRYVVWPATDSLSEAETTSDPLP